MMWGENRIYRIPLVRERMPGSSKTAVCGKFSLLTSDVPVGTSIAGSVCQTPGCRAPLKGECLAGLGSGACHLGGSGCGAEAQAPPAIG